jgi:hypothetical protein
MHRHDMNMEFPDPSSLNPLHVCKCGLSTADSYEALLWQGAFQPKFVKPMGVEEAERRRLEKIALFPLRYGVGQERLKDMLSSIPPMSRWQRFRQWCRDLVSSLTGD